jgi:hypothetical protein
MQVSWGDGMLARALARALGFPRPAASVVVVLRIQPTAGGQRWVRQMGSVLLTSTQAASNGLLIETFGVIACAFRLLPEAAGLRYQQQYAALRCGSLQLRLPGWASPRVAALVVPTAAGARTEVEIAAPLIGRVLRYEGTMEPVASVELP